MHARKLPRISEPSFDKDYFGRGAGSDGSKYYRSSSSSAKGRFGTSGYGRRSISPIDGPGSGSRGSPRDRDRDRDSRGSSSKYSRLRDKDRDRERDRGDRDRDRDRDRERERDRGGGGGGDRDRDRDYYTSSKYTPTASGSRLKDDFRDSRDRSPLSGGLKERDRDRERDRSKWNSQAHNDSHTSSSRGGSRDRDTSSVVAEVASVGGNGAINSANVALDTSKVKSVGDWSEHTSSSGKKYYYNAVSSVSQWEKPREWVDYEQKALSSAQRQLLANSNSKFCDNATSRSVSVPSSSSSSAFGMLGRQHSMSEGVNATRLSSREYPSGRDMFEGDHRRRARGIAVATCLSGGNGNGGGGQQDMDISSSRDATPTSEYDDISTDDNVSTNHVQMSSAALPQLSSHPQHFQQQQPHSQVSAQDAIKTIHTALLLTSGSTLLPSSHAVSSSAHASPMTANSSNSQSAGAQGTCESPYSGGGGPPTPTHSEMTENSSCAASSSASISSGGQHQMLSNVNSLASMATLTSLKPQIPSLTPSLSKHYKEALIGHVIGWPAEGVERAAQRFNDDQNSISNLGVTKVSAELKMARSLVRLAEIQAMLQEQRILFLRQQSLDLEAMKTPSSVVLGGNEEQYYSRVGVFQQQYQAPQNSLQPNSNHATSNYH